MDNSLLLVFDTINSFPAIMLALAIITLTGPSLHMVIAVIIITSIPSYGRIARTQTLALRGTEFILAERALGAGPVRVLGRHVMPNAIGPLLILAAMNVPVVVTIEAGSELPRAGGAPAHSELGQHPRRRPAGDPRDAVAGDRGRTAPHPHHPGIHLPRRGATRHLRPAPAPLHLKGLT